MRDLVSATSDLLQHLGSLAWVAITWPFIQLWNLLHYMWPVTADGLSAVGTLSATAVALFVYASSVKEKREAVARTVHFYYAEKVTHVAKGAPVARDLAQDAEPGRDFLEVHETRKIVTAKVELVLVRARFANHSDQLIFGAGATIYGYGDFTLPIVFGEIAPKSEAEKVVPIPKSHLTDGPGDLPYEFEFQDAAGRRWARRNYEPIVEVMPPVDRSHKSKATYWFVGGPIRNALWLKRVKKHDDKYGSYFAGEGPTSYLEEAKRLVKEGTAGGAC